jgi:hypothetical protein
MLNLFLSFKSKGLGKKHMEAADKRLQLMQELVEGIKVCFVLFRAWCMTCICSGVLASAHLHALHWFTSTAPWPQFRRKTLLTTATLRHH